MHAANYVPQVLAVVLLFSAPVSLLAQLPPSAKRSNDAFNELIRSLATPNERDDDVRKLQREQLAAAILYAEIQKAQYQRGLIGHDLAQEYQNLVPTTALELAETDEQKIQCLEKSLDVLKTIEQEVLERKETGMRGGGVDDVALVRYHRIAAEVDLLRFKRKLPDGSLVTPNERDEEIRKLLREQLAAAILCFEYLNGRYHKGLVDINLVLEYQKLVARTSFELADTEVQKVQWLEKMLELEKRIEQRVLELQKVGAHGGEAEILALARYHRIAAEIDLLRYKRLPAGSLATPNERDEDIRKLQREQLDIAVLRFEIIRNRYEQGLIKDEFVHEAEKLVAMTSLELADTEVQKLQSLEKMLELEKRIEQRVLELQKVGARGGEGEHLALARYHRIAAEVALLRLKREETGKKRTGD